MRTAVDLRQFPSDSSSCGFRAVWLGAESISVLGTQVRRKSLTIGLLALSQHSRLRSVTTPTTTKTTQRDDDTTTQQHNGTTAQQHNATTQQHNATTTQHNNTTPQRQRLLQLPTERSNANDCHSVVSQSHSRRRTVGAHRSLPLTRSPQPTAHSPQSHSPQRCQFQDPSMMSLFRPHCFRGGWMLWRCAAVCSVLCALWRCGVCRMLRCCDAAMLHTGSITCLFGSGQRLRAR